MNAIDVEAQPGSMLAELQALYALGKTAENAPESCLEFHAPEGQPHPFDTSTMEVDIRRLVNGEGLLRMPAGEGQQWLDFLQEMGSMTVAFSRMSTRDKIMLSLRTPRTILPPTGIDITVKWGRERGEQFELLDIDLINAAGGRRGLYSTSYRSELNGPELPRPGSGTGRAVGIIAAARATAGKFQQPVTASNVA